MIRWLAVFVLVLLAGPVLAKQEPPPTTRRPVTRIASGWVSGEYVGKDADVRVFRGIPYAAPPVGDLRWRPPAPVAPWEGRRDCRRFGPAAPQPSGFGRSGGHAGNQSEDCLYLNVWAPSEPAEKPYPVMVWIHGGGMVIGAGSLPFYNGESLARRGVVLVTINYRLGPFGFFGHRALSAENERNVSGNYGLLDQIAALRWVKRNAASFLGDPENVTIFGESAGGVSVGCLMASPLAKGLFHRAILQSGTANGITLPLRTEGGDSLEARGEKIAAGLGVGEAKDVAAALRALPTERILAAARPAPVSMDKSRKFGPVVDGWVLPFAPAAMWAEGLQHDVPVMIGANAQDGGVFSGAVPVRAVPGYRWLARLVFKQDADEVLRAFPARENKDVANAVRDVMTVSAFVAPSRRFARAMEKVSSPCWYYHFSRVSPLAAKSGVGAAHGFEIPYVFGNLYPWLGTDETDARLSRAMQDCWIRFARTGNPNGEGQAEWPPYTMENDAHVDFGDRIRVGRGLLKDECDLFDRIAAKTAPDSPAEPLINLPASETVGDAKVTGGPVLRLTVTSDGRVHADGRSRTHEELASMLTKFADRKRDLESPMQPSECVVVLRVDRAVTWDRARQLIAMCEAPEVRIYRVYLAVVHPKGGTEGVFAVFLPNRRGMVGSHLGRRDRSRTVGARVEMRETGPAPVPLAALSNRLLSLQTNWKSRPIWLSPDGGIRIEEVVTVLDTLYRSGATGVLFPKVPPVGLPVDRLRDARFGLLVNAEPIRHVPTVPPAPIPSEELVGGFNRAPDGGDIFLEGDELSPLAYGPHLPRLRFRAARDYSQPTDTLNFPHPMSSYAPIRTAARRWLAERANRSRSEDHPAQPGRCRVVLRADGKVPWKAVSDVLLMGVAPEVRLYDFAIAFVPEEGIREGALRLRFPMDRSLRKTAWIPEPGNRARILMRSERGTSGLAASLRSLPDGWNTRESWLMVSTDVTLDQVLAVVETLAAAGVREVIFGVPTAVTEERGLWLNGRKLEPSKAPPDESMLPIDRIYTDIRPELTLDHFGE